MRTIARWLLASAVGSALVLVGLGCGEGSESTTPPKPAAQAPAQLPAKPPAPPAPVVMPDAPSNPSEAESEAGSEAAEVSGTADVEAGKAVYQTYCTSCHGQTGDGDGPVAQTLNPKPAKHSDGNYMNPLKDDYLFKVIKFGGASVGKSAMMAPQGGALSDQQIRDVIAYIRTLAVPPYKP